jgi:hypothetical protein
MLWKFSTNILMPKPNKPPDSVTTFRPISLLPFFAKILEKLLLKLILLCNSEKSFLLDSQFVFRISHSIVQQVHRIDVISYSLKKKFIV